MPPRYALLVGLYVLNTLWTMLASIRYTPEDTELVTLQALLNDLFTRLDMAGALFSQFPILQYVAPERSGYTEFVTIHQRLWKFLRDEIDRHMETYDPNVMRDFMDVYIKMIKAGGPDSSFSGKPRLHPACVGPPDHGGSGH